jgi:O-succinylbenzoic acid--CoA ligase
VENADVIDFTSDETHLLLNPRMPEEERIRLERMAAEFPLRGHVWIATSGTSGALKLTALSKEALLISAAAVNRHLESDGHDVWALVLPTFHVGGLGIHARAFLSVARVVERGWEAQRFVDICESEGITLSSLVPAQVSDLVRGRLRAPRSVRAIVVGGGALSEELRRAGQELGWPLLPSYGMTECCSQVATATPDSPALRLLSHVDVRMDDEGCLAIRSEALLTGYAVDGEFIDPKVDGWLQTEDVGEVAGGGLRVAGRRGAFIKIGGESVDLSRLDGVLERVLREEGGDAALVAVPDDRLGHVIQLACAGGDCEALGRAFDALVLPFERARKVHRVAEIPRTPLGKLRRKALLEAVLRISF